MTTRGAGLSLLGALLLAAPVAHAQTEAVCTLESNDSLGTLVAVVPSLDHASIPMCGDAPFVAKDAPLRAPVEGIIRSGDLPLPSREPDANGYFHPAPGYSEGGTFLSPESRPQWDVPANKIARPSAPGQLRVVEWNVERGNQLDKSIRVMKSINADVWIISESDLYGKNSGNVVVAREIARALGYSYYTTTEFNERLEERKGSSGNAIISRYPLSSGALAALGVHKEAGGSDWADSTAEPRCGQRNALSAKVAIPTKDGGTRTVNVIGLHTENKSNPTVRKMQFDEARALSTPGEPTIIAGDLNTVDPFEGPKFRDFLAKDFKKNGPSAGLFDCSRGDDDTTWGLKAFVYLRIDWMLVQPGSEGTLACQPGSYRVTSNDGSSDHFPVITDFTVK